MLDNSGSMSKLGSGTGQKRIELLKAAAKQLVDTLALQAAQMKQVDKPVQFALVPFSASVNVGPTHDDDSWMDTTGISPIHHENFDWTKMTVQPTKPTTNMPRRVGDVWYKRGAGWGDGKNQPLTRFSLYADMTVEIWPRGGAQLQAVHLRCLQQEKQVHRGPLDRSASTSTRPASMPVGRAASRRGRSLQ